MLGSHRFKAGVKSGDTIVEVLFAITIFSLIAVAAVTLMNRGLALSRQSVEITTVRQQIDGQAESLRFLHNSYVDAYVPGATYAANSPAGRYASIMSSYTKTSATSFGGSAPCRIPDGTKFVINPNTARVEANSLKFRNAEIYSKLVYQESDSSVIQNIDGMWVEAVRSTAAQGGGVGFIDFHIRACWDVPGRSTPMTLGTIVRLYDPR